MNNASNLRTLRGASIAITIFAVVLILAGAVQIGLGGMAVKQEYDRIAKVEQQAREASAFYGYYRQRNDPYAEYNKSSSAFIGEGRFLTVPQDPERTSAAGIAFVVMGLAALAFLIAAMFWVWRAHANIAQAGIRSKYGPGKAVAAYLIPLVNLILPFEAMRELYNRSHGEPEDFAHSTVEDVTAWWTAVIVGLLVFSALLVKFTLDLGTNMIIMTPLWMEFALLSFAILLLLGSAFLFARLTAKITAAQVEYLPTVEPEQLTEPVPSRPRVNIVRG
ncbi:DUF4328 domain-containing protein [Qipengyuania sp. RANM35]|uniref:DUF4328 domain-containing protein n=1 Tax=Qipengyuania sp. RANM35 TaxID=3068635 RepID=UPI0034DB5015